MPVLPLKKVEKFKIDEILPRLKGLYTDDDYDNYIKEKIQKAKNEYYNNSAIINNEAKRNKVYEDIQILRELGKKVLELNEERKKFEYFKNYQKLMQIDLKLKEIKKYIENVYPYYGKEHIIYDNNDKNAENDETQPFEIKTIETNLEKEKENENNEIYEDGENAYENNNLEYGNSLPEQNQMIDNNNYDYNNYNYNQPVSAKSKEILRRHLEKKRMIKENMEIAESNRKAQDLALHNTNVVI